MRRGGVFDGALRWLPVALAALAMSRHCGAVRAASPLPDLETGIRVNAMGQVVADGQKVKMEGGRIVIAIRTVNTGTAATPTNAKCQTRYLIKKNGASVQVGSYAWGPLAPGASAARTFELTKDAPKVVVEVQVLADPDNRMSEANETNNQSRFRCLFYSAKYPSGTE